MPFLLLVNTLVQNCYFAFLFASLHCKLYWGRLGTQFSSVHHDSSAEQNSLHIVGAQTYLYIE